MSTKKIGIIGFGNMGSAIAGQIKSKYSVFIFDKDRKKIKKLSGIKLAKSAIDLANKTEVIILAVKPQDFSNLLRQLEGEVARKLIISVAAGITTKYIERYLKNAHVIRVMPNLGVKVANSVTCLCKGKVAVNADLLFAKKIFSYIGTTRIISENKMNAVTAVSGSGPAYVCYLIENALDKNNFLTEFKNAAKAVGFNQKEADFLVNNTFKSTIDVLKRTKISPAKLREQVASKGGMTEAALKVLTKGGTLKNAVKAALARAKQLSRG